MQKLINNKLIIIVVLFFLIPALLFAFNIQNWDDSIEKTEKETFGIETFADGFDIPWGMAFLPNKNLIVSDRNGDLWKINYNTKEKIQIGGVPNVRYRGQGGLLDVQIHPDFINNNNIYVGFTDYLKMKKRKLLLPLLEQP